MGREGHDNTFCSDNAAGIATLPQSKGTNAQYTGAADGHAPLTAEHAQEQLAEKPEKAQDAKDKWEGEESKQTRPENEQGATATGGAATDKKGPPEAQGSQARTATSLPT